MPQHSPPDGPFAYAAQLIEQSDALVITAGAGMGVDSGLPDFRGTSGFWKAYPALGRRQIDFIQVASPETFASDPRLAWGFYGHRLAMYRATQPHEGFSILKRWAAQLPLGAFVYTSNVDGHFQKAGFNEERVQECHGSIHWLQCTRSDCTEVWPASELSPQIDEEACRWLGELPSCPRCGALARPNILMFGDFDWRPARSQAQRDAADTWLSRVQRPVVIELGAGTQIPTVRHFGHIVVNVYGGRLIRINLREADAPTPWDVALPMGALEGLRKIDSLVCVSPAGGNHPR
jgi:NAD-dependent SIR2 family protein deacetylase